ncbi:MAG: monodechloroaminopyrrolnitrin synthase PrnB family protein [Hyphomonadaceae bacterium]
MAVENGSLSALQAAASIKSIVDDRDIEALVRVADRLGDDDALFALGALGVLASSLERHDRLANGSGRRGFGMANLPGLEMALLAFGERTGRAPRDSAETAWLIDPPWNWTNSVGEARFGNAVRQAERCLGAAAEALLPIRQGLAQLKDSADVLRFCAEQVEAYTRVQIELNRNPFPEDFLMMRNFLGTLRVGGRDYEGPNATYTRGWTGLDLAVGIVKPTFAEIALKRASHMCPNDAAAIRDSVALPSIADLTADLLGIDRSAIRSATPGQVRGTSTLNGGGARAFLEAARLSRATAMLVGVHWGAINKNLTEPVAKLSDEERTKLGVAPTGGVSGTGLRHTDELRKERQAHFLAGPNMISLIGGAP